MTTKQLARYYQTLTPWERLPLIVAASARGDVVEEDRLARSVPKHGFRVPDYWGLAEGLDDLAKQYVLKQLDLAVWYWRLTGLMEREPWSRPSRQDQQREERRWPLVRILAHRFVVRAEGWQLLCAELHLDPEVLPRQLPGYEAVKQMEEVARRAAFSAEEAQAYLGEGIAPGQAGAGETPGLVREGRLDTAAEVAQAVRAFLRERLEDWQ